MKYAYYPGCSLSSTGREYSESTIAVAGQLGIELNEIPDWSCCGASSAHCTDHLLSLALPAHTLAQAEAMQLDIAVPCAGCFNRLRGAEAALKDSRQKSLIEDALGMSLKGSVRSYSLLDIIVNQVGLEKIKEKTKRPLTGLKLACYYGCLLVRPASLTGFDDPENPQSMDQLMQALGAPAFNWPFKVECCGGNLAVPRTDIALKMSFDIINLAKESGADAIVTACPLCMVNLDTRQTQMEKQHKAKLQVPIFYFTELIGLALGLTPKELGITRHFVNPQPFFKKWEAEEKAAAEAAIKAEQEAAAKKEKAAKAKAKADAEAKEEGEA